MKKIIFPLATIITASLIYLGCSKDIHERTADLPALNPTNVDLEAGSWKLVLLSRPDSFVVAAPAATNLPGYIGELNEIKGLQENMTEDQRAKVKFWAAGAVLRMNELMRELVAKHNLPPYQNEDDTYPTPNSANPFAYPQFPFSNPPYAARAYGYVSAAQYDALVACWYYKKLYNRAAPYKVDSTINANAMAAKTDLPSYPSEQAVLAGVTAEMMKMLFPTEIAYVNAKVEELQLATMASGACVRSDWAAGEALGRQIASVFAARGRSDNTSKAVGTPAQWDSLAQACIARGETPWISLETPKRPPMLPFFGNVRPFLFDSLTVKNVLRPGPPPSTGSAQMKQETEEVKSYVVNPSAANLKIVQFWADGVGTSTPPGHWNAIASEDFVGKNFSEVRWARNLALLNMAEMDAAIVCWDTKYYYFNPRPSQMDPSIKTLTGIPNFPSYISGHSTFSGAAATILGHIIPERADDYMKMAEEAARSRLLGGIHYNASDCKVGMDVGKNVGNYAVQRALIDGAE